MRMKMQNITKKI